MGNTLSNKFSENTNRSYTSVNKFDSPLPTKKHIAEEGTVVLKDDPRSPTIAIPRTPIEIKTDEDDSSTPVSKFSKTTFSYGVDKSVENSNPQDEETEDSAFLTSNDPAKNGKSKSRPRVPLREATTPTSFLRYKQARKLERAIDESMQPPKQSSVKKRK
ncbi:hypothetical protein CHUAL_009073 [Chamberlinius hualienensis]